LSLPSVSSASQRFDFLLSVAVQACPPLLLSPSVLPFFSPCSSLFTRSVWQKCPSLLTVRVRVRGLGRQPVVFLANVCFSFLSRPYTTSCCAPLSIPDITQFFPPHRAPPGSSEGRFGPIAHLFFWVQRCRHFRPEHLSASTFLSSYENFPPFSPRCPCDHSAASDGLCSFFVITVPLTFSRGFLNDVFRGLSQFPLLPRAKGVLPLPFDNFDVKGHTNAPFPIPFSSSTWTRFPRQLCRGLPPTVPFPFF